MRWFFAWKLCSFVNSIDFFFEQNKKLTLKKPKIKISIPSLYIICVFFSFYFAIKFKAIYTNMYVKQPLTFSKIKILSYLDDYLFLYLIAHYFLFILRINNRLSRYTTLRKPKLQKKSQLFIFSGNSYSKVWAHSKFKNRRFYFYFNSHCLQIWVK